MRDASVPQPTWDVVTPPLRHCDLASHVGPLGYAAASLLQVASTPWTQTACAFAHESHSRHWPGVPVYCPRGHSTHCVSRSGRQTPPCCSTQPRQHALQSWQPPSAQLPSLKRPLGQASQYVFDVGVHGVCSAFPFGQTVQILHLLLLR